MTDRAQAKTDFLERCGWADACHEFLAGDASDRSYDRVMRPSTGHSAILMDAPPEKDNDLLPFVRVTEELRARGLSAPGLFAADQTHGFLLTEDLGDALYARVCRGKPALETPLYSAAVDVLVHLRTAAPPDDFLRYDTAVYVREAGLLTDWYLPAVTGAGGSERAAELTSLIAKACDALNAPYDTLVLRDFHAENLLWLPDRQGLSRVGLIDYQDALAGHAMYDLVSLLEDARRDTSDALQSELIKAYNTRTNGGFDAVAYATLGAQRNIKILGIFARLALRDGKYTYLSLMPRVWRHLQRDLAHTALCDLRDWVADHVPEPTPEVLQRLDDRARNA